MHHCDATHISFFSRAPVPCFIQNMQSMFDPPQSRRRLKLDQNYKHKPKYRYSSDQHTFILSFHLEPCCPSIKCFYIQIRLRKRSAISVLRFWVLPLFFILATVSSFAHNLVYVKLLIIKTAKQSLKSAS